jgi:N-methylhydantoinase A
VEQALQPLGLPVSVSHRILPEFREYERASTVVVNAYLAPKMEGYLGELERRVRREYGARVEVMQSSGGILPVRLAASEPVRTVLSGPAGGVIGACRMARQAGFDRVIGLDMGGTSTDVFLADSAGDGPALTGESVVAGAPLSVPMLDIHTTGAGGGSIARFDAGGMLRVGPESAGADPGPICFGRGKLATVTDANLLLGRLDEGSFLGGAVRLHRTRAYALLSAQKGPLDTAEEFAAGILRVVETGMERAIRIISVERGHDPRDFTLVAFGGGGPLHACALARALRIPRVLVPALPGALSAVGILLADSTRDYSQTVMLSQDHWERVEAIYGELEERARKEFAAEGQEGEPQRSLDLRYRGQGYELNVPWGEDALDAFHRLHEKRYGFADQTRPLEIVNVRIRMVAAGSAYAQASEERRAGDGAQASTGERRLFFDGVSLTSRTYDRELLVSGDQLRGPALVTEYSSATVVPPDCALAVDEWRNLVIEVQG